MSIDLDTHKAPRPQPRPRLELPPIVRDYLEHVRGNPEMFGRILPDYLDRLWAQAIDFATHNAVTCPIHREEIDALRTAIEGGVFSEAVSCRGEAALVNEPGPVSSVTSAPAKSLRKSARDARCPGTPLKKKRLFPQPPLRRLAMVPIIEDRGKISSIGKGRSIAPQRGDCGIRFASLANRREDKAAKKGFRLSLERDEARISSRLAKPWRKPPRNARGDF